MPDIIPVARIPTLTGVYLVNLDEDFRLNQPAPLDVATNHRNIVLSGLAWVSLLGDSPLGLKPRRVIHKFHVEFVTNYSACIKRYSELADLLLGSLRFSGRDIIITPLVSEFKGTPVQREYLTFLRSGSPSLLRFLLTFLMFNKKAHFERPDFESSALRAWLEVEERLSKLELPRVLVANLKTILRVAFQTWNFKVFLPKHGGGAVSERGVSSRNEKNTHMTLDPKVKRLYVEGTMMTPLSEINDPTPGLRDFHHDKTMNSAARLKFVAKNYKSVRSICMEPIDLQWAQQGVRLQYEEWLSSSIFRGNVVLEDQTRNQEMARLGSLTGLVDTIDLSAASDSVSWDLVKQIFPAKVLKHLAATRSRMVILPDGVIKPVSKFAPMGSALCFPVQSTIYAALTLLNCMAEFTGQDFISRDVLHASDVSRLKSEIFGEGVGHHGLIQPFVCYGDDIIVDKAVTSNLVRSLTALGFEVNTSKSFTGDSAIRESCGIYAFVGKDVTPYTFKPKKIGSKLSAEAVVGLIDAANRAKDEGYHVLRSTLINFVLRQPIANIRMRQGLNPIAFTSDRETSAAFFCDKPRNTHLQTREPDYSNPPVASRDLAIMVYEPAVADAHSPGYSKYRRAFPPSRGTHNDYCRSEVKRLVLRTTCHEDDECRFDNYRLMAWWRSRYGTTGTPAIAGGRTTAYPREVGVTVAWSHVA